MERTRQVSALVSVATAVLVAVPVVGCALGEPSLSRPARVESRAHSSAPPAIPDEPMVGRGGILETRDSFNLDETGLRGRDTRVNQDFTSRFQNEPAVAVDPNDSQRLAAAWIDNSVFDPSNGLQRSRVATGWSADGGATWQSSVPDFPSLTNSQTADPSVAFDGMGNVFLAFLPYDQFKRSDPDLNQIQVARSTDGGASYGAPVAVDSGSVDKPYLVVDPTSQDLHVVWVDFSGTEETVYFSRSTDQGASFSPRVAVSSPTSPGTGPVPAVGPDGTIYVVWNDRNETVWFDRSSDGGSTWLPVDVAVNASVVPPDSPLEGGFRNPPFPSIAVDLTGGPFHGRLYVVWPDQRFGDPDVLLSWSADSGTSWSQPVRVHDDAAGNEADQFFPWISVDGSGAVHVTFLDRRDDLEGRRCALYLATSTDGGESFGPNVRVSDGAYLPVESFLGDYTGSIRSGNALLPLWPDARSGDQDVYTHRIDTSDFDGDGVLNDGDGSGGYSDSPCASGQIVSCDDNCPGQWNPDQEDTDGDGVGNVCDNCRATPNPDRTDLDRDGAGDACDPCPGRAGFDGSDADGDELVACEDNCPSFSNPEQLDDDGDGIGNPCDPCPDDAVNDPDEDAVCAVADSCPLAFNPMQGDDDLDGIGNVCDACPFDADPGATDSDGDGIGDVCDCQSLDPNDRPPREVQGVRAFRASDGVHFAWRATGPDDLYSVSRGLISSLDLGEYGSCLAEGLSLDGLEDFETPPSDDGFFYLISAQNFECGLGSLGTDSLESIRANSNPASCVGAPRTDVYAHSEQTVYGSVIAGSLSSTTASDDASESIREEVAGGSPSTRYTRLEHRWTFQVPAGSVLELHVEFSQSSSLDGDEFRYEYSSDGTVFQEARLVSSSFFEDSDRVYELPASLAGTVTVRVVDTDRTPGQGAAQDTVSVDELFLRSVP